MPYLYELKLDEQEPAYTFLQRLVSPGTLVGEGQAVAVLSDGSMEFHLPAPRQGLLVEWYAASGETVQTGDVIARVVCEGTESPVPGAVPERLG
ncbi:MAG TPA: biotin/lipoyl-containing protein [Granulicella sp.]